jgi:uncharacterized protein (DUF2235 family)
MGTKKLVLCFDGTSNRYCSDNTNVVKLLALLDKRALDQLVYYQPGIGTFAPPGTYGRLKHWVLTRIDLAFATLLKYHVQDGYQFLMRYYEEGDEIYIFGFSRGAYTARVLAGMLYKVGLLAQGNEEMVQFAWQMYVKRDAAISRGFRNTFGRRVSVAFMGLWDTVSSVRWALRPVSLPHTRDNPIVATLRHAVSLDERRAYFRSNLWIDPPRVGQDALQVWFPGVHCDVGGGYVERDSGLAKIALKWMVDQIGGRLASHPAAIEQMLPPASNARFSAPSATSVLHRSLHGLWWIVEYIPKQVHLSAQDPKQHWILPLGRARDVPSGSVIHSSVRERIRAGIGYAPKNLPPDYAASNAISGAEIANTGAKMV